MKLTASFGGCMSGVFPPSMNKINILKKSERNSEQLHLHHAEQSVYQADEFQYSGKKIENEIKLVELPSSNLTRTSAIRAIGEKVHLYNELVAHLHEKLFSEAWKLGYQSLFNEPNVNDKSILGLTTYAGIRINKFDTSLLLTQRIINNGGYYSGYLLKGYCFSKQKKFQHAIKYWNHTLQFCKTDHQYITVLQNLVHAIMNCDDVNCASEKKQSGNKFTKRMQEAELFNIS